jgi:hypothetical protein
MGQVVADAIERYMSSLKRHALNRACSAVVIASTLGSQGHSV